MPIITIFIQHSTGIPSQIKGKKKKIKLIQIGKEEVELSLFADDMILYIGNTKNPSKKLLELIKKSVLLQDTKSIYNNPLNYLNKYQKEKLRK